MADLQAEIQAAADEMVAAGTATTRIAPGGVPSRRGSTFGMVGANGSAAYADIDSGLAVAVMRNGPAAGGLAAAARIDRLIAEQEQEEHP